MRLARAMAAVGLLLLSGAATADPLRDKLQLTSAQLPLFEAWQATNIGDKARRKQLSAQQLAARTTPEFVESAMSWLDYRREWTVRAVAAVRTLYATLTPSQRAIMDENFRPKTEKDAPPVPPIPTAEQPSAPDLKAEETVPDWIRKPSGEELSAFYPLRALTEEKSGTATITCYVSTLGIATDCRVVAEEPKDYGFGNATIEVASGFRFRAKTVFGVPTLGAVTIPLRWQLEASVPAEAGAAPKNPGR